MTIYENPQKSRSGLKRLLHATGYSLDGIRAAYRNEKAFRLEVKIAAVMFPVAFWLGHGWVEVALLAGSLVAVLAAELVNSAIEAVVDRISLDLHDLSKRAKDLGSACVLLMVLLTLGIWGAAIWTHIGAHIRP